MHGTAVLLLSAQDGMEQKCHHFIGGYCTYGTNQSLHAHVHAYSHSCVGTRTVLASNSPSLMRAELTSRKHSLDPHKLSVSERQVVHDLYCMRLLKKFCLTSLLTRLYSTVEPHLSAPQLSGCLDYPALSVAEFQLMNTKIPINAQ